MEYSKEMEALSDDVFLRKFVDTIIQNGEDGCWGWRKSFVKAGYGQLIKQFDGKSVKLYAHRLSWTLRHWEPIPEGYRICHHCDNPNCCNPDHLFLGTDKDNKYDARKKGRAYLSDRERLMDVIAARVMSPNHDFSEINEILGWNINNRSVERIIKNRRYEDHNWDPHNLEYVGNPFEGTVYEPFMRVQL